MPFTKREQKQFEKMVREECSAGEKPKRWIKKVADFLFEMTGDVNWRMSISDEYER